jgi:tetratricopeptide (TPR) repeat protein/DNA-binding CsgD family transcriptional regulator
MPKNHQVKEPLSRREDEVARAYASGLSYKHIAAQFGVAPATVRTHLETIYRKLGVSTKFELAAALPTPAGSLSLAAPEAASQASGRSPVDFGRLGARQFVVAIARIENDSENELQQILATDLAEARGIGVVCLDEVITTAGPLPEQATADGEQHARVLMRKTGASVLVWGKVLRFAGTAVPQLRLSTQRDRSQRPGRYPPNQELRLPRVFWMDISKVLRMIVAALNAEFLDLEGHYLVERLEPFVARVHLLLQGAGDATGWSREAVGQTRAILGDCETLLGIQSGQRVWLERAVSSFEAALDELGGALSGDEIPRAMTGLGIALWTLGDRGADGVTILRGVSALRSAIGARDPATDPLGWSNAHNHLGNALSAAAKLQEGAGLYQQALESYEVALASLRVDEHPLDWAQVKNNIAVSLWRVGRRREDLDILRRAKLELTGTFQVYEPTATPLDWSQSENNLGLVCWDIARLGGERALYREAIDHFDRALRERDPARVPLLWAQTHNNIGLAYLSIGDETGDVEALRKAVQAFRLSLEERTRERARGDWLESCNNLGTALWRLSERMNSTDRLEEAIETFRVALEAIDGSSAPAVAVELRRNLGNALASLGGREGERAYYVEAVDYLEAAVAAVPEAEAPILAAEIFGDIALTAKRLGEDFREPAELDRARHAFERAAAAYDAADLPRHAAACHRQAEALAGQTARGRSQA